MEKESLIKTLLNLKEKDNLKWILVYFCIFLTIKMAPCDGKFKFHGKVSEMQKLSKLILKVELEFSMVVF